MKSIRYLVKEELVRHQVVTIEIPDDLLDDGETPDHIFDADRAQMYDEYVTERVYLEAHTQARWDTKTNYTDWEEAEGTGYT